MKNHKQRRDLLFKKDRPYIRPLQIVDESGYTKDVRIIWVAHKNKPIPFLADVKTQEEFVKMMIEATHRLPFYVVEDRNSEFKDKGIVALIATKEDGWRIEPHVHFFPWATRRNILRTCIGFFQMVRYSRNIGVCVVRSLKENAGLFDKCVNYFPPNVFHRVGRIPMGDARGDEFLYSIRGRKWAA